MTIHISANGDGPEDRLDAQIAGLAGTLVTLLQQLRVFQAEMENLRGSTAPELDVLKYAAAHMRMALGNEGMLGLLDFAGVQQVQGWLDRAVLDGHYLSLGESYEIYRFDTVHGSLYSSPVLSRGETSYWYPSIDAVSKHLTKEVGAQPDGTYEFIPVTVTDQDA